MLRFAYRGMARRLRLQYEGAVYHVINRGNYRRDLFETADKAKAFERVLFECCERMHWRLFAYVLMRNHFHLAIETPQANLVAGMHWLQTTFATRFNGYRHENGHLFQGRYRSILVEPGPALLRVVNYIHLNPARAGIVEAERVTQFRWSSLKLFSRKDRPSFLAAADWLSCAGLADDQGGWRQYLQTLTHLAKTSGDELASETEELTRGWAIGTPSWRKAVAEDHAHLKISQEVSRSELRAIEEARWQAALATLLVQHGRRLDSASHEAKGASWKVEIAHALRSSTTATHAWIADTLRMGSANSLRRLLSLTKASRPVVSGSSA